MNGTPSQKNILMIAIALIIVACIYIAYTMPNSCPTQTMEMPHVESFGHGGGSGGHSGSHSGGGARSGSRGGSWRGRGGWGRRRFGNRYYDGGLGYFGYPYYYGDWDPYYPIVGATCEASTKYSPCSTLRPIKVGYDALGAGYATEWQCCSS